MTAQNWQSSKFRVSRRWKIVQPESDLFLFRALEQDVPMTGSNNDKSEKIQELSLASVQNLRKYELQVEKKDLSRVAIWKKRMRTMVLYCIVLTNKCKNDQSPLSDFKALGFSLIFGTNGRLELSTLSLNIICGFVTFFAVSRLHVVMSLGLVMTWKGLINTCLRVHSLKPYRCKTSPIITKMEKVLESV